MDERYKIFERLQAYQRGDLSEAEMKEVDAELLKNKDYQEEKALLDQIGESLESAFTQNLKDCMRRADEVKSPKMNPSFLRIAASVVLIFTVGIGGFMIYRASQNSLEQKLFAEYFVAHEGLPLKSGVEDDVFREANQNYRDGEFRQAAEKYEILLEKDTYAKNDTALFFFGLSNLALDKAGLAVGPLSSLDGIYKSSSTGRKAFEDDTGWYLALSYLELEQKALALQYLRQIQQDRRHKYNDKAIQLLQKLK